MTSYLVKCLTNRHHTSQLIPDNYLPYPLQSNSWVLIAHASTLTAACLLERYSSNFFWISIYCFDLPSSLRWDEHSRKKYICLILILLPCRIFWLFYFFDLFDIVGLGYLRAGGLGMRRLSPGSCPSVRKVWQTFLEAWLRPIIINTPKKPWRKIIKCLKIWHLRLPVLSIWRPVCMVDSIMVKIWYGAVCVPHGFTLFA